MLSINLTLIECGTPILITLHLINLDLGILAKLCLNLIVLPCLV